MASFRPMSCLLLYATLCVSVPARADDAADAVLDRVSESLSKLNSLAFAVRYSPPSAGAQHADVTIDVLMSRDGRFRIRASMDGQDLAGMLCDGLKITEWDKRTERWTSYPLDQRPDTGSPMRLLSDTPGTVPLTFAFTRYARSWLGHEAGYEWVAQRIRSVPGRAHSQQSVDGRACDVIRARHREQSGILQCTQSIMFAFDRTTHLPVLETISAQFPLAGKSEYRFAYSDWAVNPPTTDADFAWDSGALAYVRPETLRAPQSPLIGASARDWKFTLLDG